MAKNIEELKNNATLFFNDVLIYIFASVVFACHDGLHCNCFYSIVYYSVHYVYFVIVLKIIVADK